MNSGMPGRTNTPRPTSPITGSQQYFARGLAALHLRDRIEDRGAGVGRAHVAREHAVALSEHAARRDAAHQFGDQRGLEHAAGPLAIAGVIGELHGVHRPYLDADALQRKRRGGVADMAVGDVRLDREDVHDRLSNKRGGSMVPPRADFQPNFVIAAISRRDRSCGLEVGGDVPGRTVRRLRIEGQHRIGRELFGKLAHRMPLGEQNQDIFSERFRSARFISDPTRGEPIGRCNKHHCIRLPDRGRDRLAPSLPAQAFARRIQCLEAEARRAPSRPVPPASYRGGGGR